MFVRRTIQESKSATQLITVGFSRLQPRMTMARTLKLYRLPDAPLTPGLRQLRAEDAPQARLRLRPVFSADWLTTAQRHDHADHDLPHLLISHITPGSCLSC
jgi:glycylpeptide N-tetradecanoyltransferase